MENKCIYSLKSGVDATFESREHIFPAGIGGKNKLEIGMVCDEVNNMFSKLELNFMRNSIVMMPRVLSGPGKRGDLKRGTKSKIMVMKTEKLVLGYVEKGIPKIIPQIRIPFYEINKNDKIALDGKFTPENYEKEIEDLKKSLKESCNYKIFEKDLKENDFIIGIFEGKLIIAGNQKSNFDEFENFLKGIEKKLEIEKNSAVKEDIENPSCSFKFDFNANEYFRVCAKIAFNSLAYLKGREFVLQKSFDKIRNFIFQGGTNEYINLCPDDKFNEVEQFLPKNQNCHYFIVTSNENGIIGILSLYGIKHCIKISEKAEGLFLDGIVCDWKNKKEVLLLDVINNATSNKI